MFRQAELERLRLQKELLVLRSDANRLLLAAQWQQVRSPQRWLEEAGQAARRHPLWTAALGLGAGILAVKALRRPTAAAGWLSRVGQLASAALALRKLFDRKDRAAHP